MAPILPPAQNAVVLTSRLYDADSDIRYMSLNDLKSIFDGPSSAFLAHDYNQCAKIVDGFLHTLVDTNGEVQNLTIKCLGSFVLKSDPKILSPLVYKITDLTTEDSIDSSIPALAVRAIIVALPRPTPAMARGYAAVSRVLIPRLVGYTVIPHGDKTRPVPPKGLLEADLENGTDSNFIDVLTEIAKCFGPMLLAAEVQALQEITLQLLESERSGSIMKKKAVVALSTLAHYFSDPLLSSIISHIIESLRNVHLTSSNRKLYITILGAMAKAVPHKFGPYLKTLAPFVFSALSQEELDAQIEAAAEDEERDPELDDTREAALITLEKFLSSCPSDMSRFGEECLTSTLRYLKYDPNVAMFDDDEDINVAEDEEEGADFDVDEDFEEEGGADDEDDLSWKVRRGAAKTLHTIVSVRSGDLLDGGETYDRVAKALIERLKEREDSVRLEVLATLAFLIRRTGESELGPASDLISSVEQSLKVQSQSKKRRRGDSDVSMSDAVKSGRYTGSNSPEAHNPPSLGPQASLAMVSSAIVAGTLKLLKTAAIPTKQAAVVVLKQLVVAQQGGVAEQLDGIFNALIELLETYGADIKLATGVFSGASGTATAATLQTEILQLTSEVAKTHSSSSLVSHVPKLIPAIAKVTRSKSSKVSCEGLLTIEQLVKALTPPRSASKSEATSKQIQDLYEVIAELAQSKSVDLTVRRQGLLVLGTLLGRTLGPQGAKLLPQNSRVDAQELLYDSARNETTRYASIKAIDTIAELAPAKTEFDCVWFGKICLELGSQLRKADRALRGASLKALRVLTYGQTSVQKLDRDTLQQLVNLLLPLLTTDDLHLLGPALLVLATLVRNTSGNFLDETFNKQICQLLLGPAAGQVLSQLMELVTVIGEQKAGQPLMHMLLRDVGINGGPTIVGKVIGGLLVAGGQSVGVKVDDFLKELAQATDERRKCLALSILGEVGRRSGASNQLSPDLFISYFKAEKGEVPLAAAIALGRVSAGNVEKYVPAVLARVRQYPQEQYLALHSIKEILLDRQAVKSKLAPFTNSLWQTAVVASQSEESRTVGAECVASLTILDPDTFLPSLKTLLNDGTASVRGLGILAFRDVISGSDGSYDKFLRPNIADSLASMMQDQDLVNRRSAFNAFNAAIKTKPDLVLQHLGQLMPLVVAQTIIDPKLIREVSMGPFKHKVDDGLEIRKSAYETLYAAMETAPSRLDFVALYDRVVAGVADDHSVRSLCNLILLKLMVLAPEETVRRLDELADQFRAILTAKAKENAVRHEVEKVEDSKKGVIAVSLELFKAFPAEAGTTAAGQPAGRPKWSNYLDDMRQEQAALVKEVEKEMKEKERT